MIINLEWDANALAAPQSFRTSIQAAANILDAALSDPITVNVTVGYGEIGLGTSQYEPLDGNVSQGGFSDTIFVSYPALLAALRSHEASATQAQLLASLPQAVSLNSMQTFFVSAAQAKALGVLPAEDTNVDGFTGFPTSFTGTTLISAAVAEIVHALGLSNGIAGFNGLHNAGFIESLDSYTSPGVHYFGSGSSAYFSLDGGATSLASYDVGFDNTLFTNVPNSMLTIPISGVTTLSTLDLEQLSAEGFDTGAAVALPAPSTVPTTVSKNGFNMVSDQNVYVPVGQSISAASMIASAAVGGSGLITTYSITNAGTDGGFFSIGGVALPAGQPFYVFANQLGQVQYTAPAKAGTDTFHIFAGVDGNGPSGQASDSSVTAFATSPAPYVVNDLSYAPSAVGANHVIDLANFEASFPDLIRAFGMNTQAMASWFAQHEPVENRAETFNGLDYIASYKDLIAAFGQPGFSTQAIQDEGAAHFISNGLSEGRTTTFNALDYIASYSDLAKAFGLNADAGAMHFIDYGLKEGRSISFDGLDYIASYKDLISAFGANEQAGAAHFISNGLSEGRTTTFDGLDYIASYADLTKAFGLNADAGAIHFITNGFKEGRSVSFDGLSYIANYTDLMQVFGANNDAGAAHYIQNGINEHRNTAFDVQGYEAAHPDLKGAYSSNDAFLTAYINTYVQTGHLLT